MKKVKILKLKCNNCGEELEIPEYLLKQKIGCYYCHKPILTIEKNKDLDGWEGDLINQL